MGISHRAAQVYSFSTLSLWHLDGYHKLIRYALTLIGCQLVAMLQCVEEPQVLCRATYWIYLFWSVYVYSQVCKLFSRWRLVIHEGWTGILEFRYICTAQITTEPVLFLSSLEKQSPGMVCHPVSVSIKVGKMSMFLCISLITHSEGRTDVR